jgi:hypothetical protein
MEHTTTTSGSEPAAERRRSPRHAVAFRFHEYADGVRHEWEALELSATGLVGSALGEPSAMKPAVALELVADNERIWLCARPVWSEGTLRAYELLGPSARDLATLSSCNLLRAR